ncbi:MAG: aminodeoxychorismate/anthranilate synthase component II [Cytophagales bacterium]|nr:aminodeoxychorismate/anthranilate synthase component II [Cytophagales bacterium]
MSARLLLLDNHDSFTYNLAQLVEENFEGEWHVKSYEEVSLAEVSGYNKIIFSPGPGIPSQIPLMRAILITYGKTASILGVCLGHQAIAEAFGGRLYNMGQVWHGKRVAVRVIEPQERLFKNMPLEFYAGLYHSWAVDSLPDCLQVTAISAHGVIMALRHRHYDIKGVQFHPESFMTEYGAVLLRNWLNKNQSDT